MKTVLITFLVISIFTTIFLLFEKKVCIYTYEDSDKNILKAYTTHLLSTTLSGNSKVVTKNNITIASQSFTDHLKGFKFIYYPGVKINEENNLLFTATGNSSKAKFFGYANGFVTTKKMGN